MNRKNTLWLLLDSIFVIVFNVVFFIAGGAKLGASAWVSYGFIHFAYLTLILLSQLELKNIAGNTLGLASYSLLLIHFIATFLIGVVFILLNLRSYKPGLIVHIIITAIFCFLFIVNTLANDRTTAEETRHKAELLYIKDSSAMLEEIMDLTEDKTINRKIEELYDLIHASPARSNRDAREFEMEVMDSIERLSDLLQKGDTYNAMLTINRIKKYANQRTGIVSQSN